jgi:hypothetical protein
MVLTRYWTALDPWHTVLNYLQQVAFTHFFHCSLLKAYKGAATTTIHPLPESIVEHQPAHFPVVILQKRTVLRNTKEVTQVLVQWSDLSLEDASWEDEDSLDLSRLEDKSPGIHSQVT